jgi:DNA polymerase/3'-5' exonuclease PolX
MRVIVSAPLNNKPDPNIQSNHKLCFVLTITGLSKVREKLLLSEVETTIFATEKSSYIAPVVERSRNERTRRLK